MPVGWLQSSTRIKDAGIAIRHSQGYIISILQGLEMGWRGWKWCVRGLKIMKKVNGLQTRLKKKHIFHPSSQARARSTGPGPGPAKNDDFDD